MKRLLSGVLGKADPGERPFVGGLVFGLAHGVVFGLAFPPFGAWLLALAAPLPLLVTLARTRGAWWSALGTLLGAAPMWAWHHWWVADVTTIGYPLMVVTLSCFPAAFVLIGARLRARWAWLPLHVFAPLLWAGLEVLRGEVAFTGYPWFLLAHPMIEWLVYGWASATVGVYALSALTALPGAVVASYLVDGWKNARFGAVVLMFFVLLLSTSQAPPNVPLDARIVVVQTAVPQSNRGSWSPEQRVADFVRTMALTILALDRWPDADLVVWPETMFPGFTLSPGALAMLRDRGLPTPYADRVQDFSGGAFRGVPWLIGAIAVEGYALTEVAGQAFPDEAWDDRYNSMFLLEDGRIVERYDKRRLAPFGEVLPYFNMWPWLERQALALGARGMSFDLTAGEDATVFETGGGGLAVGTPICFEAAAHDVCRELVYTRGGDRRAELLVNATNDGWFAGHPGGRASHLLVARWRAAGLRTPVVRAANTGISAGIDRSGRVIAGTFIDERGDVVGPAGPVDAWGAMAVDVRLGVGPSGAWLGGWIAWGLGVVLVIGVIGAIVPRRLAAADGVPRPEEASAT